MDAEGAPNFVETHEEGISAKVDLDPSEKIDLGNDEVALSEGASETDEEDSESKELSDAYSELGSEGSDDSESEGESEDDEEERIGISIGNGGGKEFSKEKHAESDKDAKEDQIPERIKRHMKSVEQNESEETSEDGREGDDGEEKLAIETGGSKARKEKHTDNSKPVKEDPIPVRIKKRGRKAAEINGSEEASEDEIEGGDEEKCEIDKGGSKVFGKEKHIDKGKAVKDDPTPALVKKRGRKAAQQNGNKEASEDGIEGGDEEKCEIGKGGSKAFEKEKHTDKGKAAKDDPTLPLVKKRGRKTAEQNGSEEASEDESEGDGKQKLKIGTGGSKAFGKGKHNDNRKAFKDDSTPALVKKRGRKATEQNGSGELSEGGGKEKREFYKDASKAFEKEKHTDNGKAIKEDPTPVLRKKGGKKSAEQSVSEETSKDEAEGVKELKRETDQSGSKTFGKDHTDDDKAVKENQTPARIKSGRQAGEGDSETTKLAPQNKKRQRGGWMEVLKASKAESKDKPESSSKTILNKVESEDRPESSITIRVRNIKAREKSKFFSEREVKMNPNIKGVIFMCSTETKNDCFRYQILGLPNNKKDIVEQIYSGMRLFLFDTDLKLMYGIYKAVGVGGSNIEPKAFQSKFPSQVRFAVHQDCLPLAETDFREVIKDNYFSKSKFDITLNSMQVRELCELFIHKSRRGLFKRHGKSKTRKSEFRNSLASEIQRSEPVLKRRREAISPVETYRQLLPSTQSHAILPQYMYERPSNVGPYTQETYSRHRSPSRTTQNLYDQELPERSSLQSCYYRDARSSYMEPDPYRGVSERIATYRGYADAYPEHHDRYSDRGFQVDCHLDGLNSGLQIDQHPDNRNSRLQIDLHPDNMNSRLQIDHGLDNMDSLLQIEHRSDSGLHFDHLDNRYPERGRQHLYPDSSAFQDRVVSNLYTYKKDSISDAYHVPYRPDVPNHPDPRALTVVNARTTYHQDSYFPDLPIADPVYSAEYRHPSRLALLRGDYRL